MDYVFTFHRSTGSSLCITSWVGSRRTRFQTWPPCGSTWRQPLPVLYPLHFTPWHAFTFNCLTIVSRTSQSRYTDNFNSLSWILPYGIYYIYALRLSNSNFKECTFLVVRCRLWFVIEIANLWETIVNPYYSGVCRVREERDGVPTTGGRGRPQGSHDRTGQTPRHWQLCGQVRNQLQNLPESATCHDFN